MNAQPNSWYKPVLFVLIVAGLACTAWLTKDMWQPLLFPATAENDESDDEKAKDEIQAIKLSKQALDNLQVNSRPIKPQTYWRKILVPGGVVDRPGHSDRGVTSPAVGIVTQIHAFPGDTVKPGTRLFSVRVFSEYLQNTQKELYTSTKDQESVVEQLKRLRPLADRGSVPKTRIIELENRSRRNLAIIKADRQDLLSRGLNPQQVQNVASGKFVSRIDVVAPPIAKQTETTSQRQAYEVQELNAELGQQVQAGQLLATLADHSSLYIEGHAFKREATLLERAAQNALPITVEFAEDAPERWPTMKQSFRIRHLSNAIDTKSRTFGFFIPLSNQSRSYKKGNETFMVWRFRPGQRVRLHVPVEKFDNVLVLPATAIVREGPEAYLFQQNGLIFQRRTVRLLHEDRLNVVIANDGSIPNGAYIARNAAASLNRVLRAQSSSGDKPNFHVHADGTVHAGKH